MTTPNITPIGTGNPPTRRKRPEVSTSPEAIEARLSELRLRIYGSAATVQMMTRAVDGMDDEGMNHEMVALGLALSMVEKTLEDIARDLEAPFVLGRVAA
jgi:hypothetical protein